MPPVPRIMNFRSSALAILTLGFCLPLPSMALGVGGGTTVGGLDGEYFANADLTGSPAFTRRDVRVDFQWGSTLNPSGVNTQPGFKDFPKDNFSVRWTGQIIPKFTETYTLKTIVEDGARLYVKAAGAGSWTTVINQWGASGTHTGTFAFTAGQKYDVKLEYRETTGTATCRLLWSSASTPEEVIETVTPAGINIDTHAGDWYADAIRYARMEWRNAGFSENKALWPALDPDGWPMGDASTIIFEYWTGNGTFGLRFNGKAQVAVGITNASFTANGVNYGSTLPSGAGYDPVTNTTTATFTVSNATIGYLTLTQTQRTEASPVGSGFTNLKLMKPIIEGGSTHHPFDQEYRDPIQTAWRPFSTFRFLTANFVRQSHWGDSTTPWSQREASDYVGTTDPAWPAPVYRYPGNWAQQSAFWNKAGAISWEKQIEVANMAGKDIHITIPYYANADYVLKLAQTIRYGSDGFLPYTSEQANPFFPPLNPNLKIYIEWSNEMWNFGFEQFFHLLAESRAIRNDTNHPERPILLYDGIDAGANSSNEVRVMWRLLGLRIVQASSTFRSVFGDSAMMTRVRPLLFGQYDSADKYEFLQFIDDWFNNADGQNHVVTPRPVNYYIWGGGGASYYGASNSSGAQTATTFPGDSFESPALGAGAAQAAPGGAFTIWSGAAGIYNQTNSGRPAPPVGLQAAYLSGAGSSLAQTVNFTATGHYAIDFQAAGANSGKLDVYLDGVKITPGSSWKWKTPSLAAPYQPGSSFGLATSTVFQITTPGAKQIEFRATGGNVYIDRLRVLSVDTMFSGEIPYNTSTRNHEDLLKAESNLVSPYGLAPYLYEGGWGVSSSADSGGSDTSTTLNNFAKYEDARARVVNRQSGEAFQRTGGKIYCFGSFGQWYDAANVANEPIWQSFVDLGNQLPPAPTNGVSVPATLTAATVTASRRYNGGGSLQPYGWMSWNIIVPTSGNYTLTASTSGSGTLAFLLNGGTSLGTGAAGSALSNTRFLTAGFHSVMVRSTGGSVTVDSVSVQGQNALAATTITTAVDGDGQVVLNWSVTGPPYASKYIVAYGPSPGTYTQFIDVGYTNTRTITGLTNLTSYYFTVYAVNASGIWSLPAPERSVMPFGEQDVTDLVAWDFYGAQGNEVAAPVTLATGRLGAVSSLSRGSGLKVSTYTSYNSFAALSSGGYSTTLADALAAGKYYQFTVNVPAGSYLSLQQLQVGAFFQDSAPLLGLAYSNDGVNFTTLPMVGTPHWANSVWTVNLASESALQIQQNKTFTFRIITANTGGYSYQGLGNGAGYDVRLIGSLSTDARPQAVAPSFSPLPGTYGSARNVTLASTTPGVSIRYTTDGTVPSDTVGTLYSGPIAVAADTTIKAVAYSNDFRRSPVSSGTYYIRPGMTEPPQFSLPAGSYSSVQTVTITSETPGASIRYTTDGTIPSAYYGNLYNGPVTLTTHASLNAVAYKDGMDPSSVSSSSYSFAFPITAYPDPLSFTLPAGGDYTVPIQIGNGAPVTRNISATVVGSGADDNYTWADTSASFGSWVDLSVDPSAKYISPTEWTNYDEYYSQGWAVVNGSKRIPVGFTFPFYGQSFDTVAISSYGFVAFNDYAQSFYGLNYPIPNANIAQAPRNMIAAFWGYGLVTNSGDYYVRYKQTDADTFVVEYKTRQLTNPLYACTYQIVLKRDGTIHLRYRYNTHGPNQNGGDGGISYAIGLNNATGTKGLQIARLQAFLPYSGIINKQYTLTPPASWLVASAVPTPVAANSTANMNLLFRTQGLTLGQTLTTHINLASGADDQPSVNLPVTLSIGSAQDVTTLQLAATSYSFTETGGNATLTVARTGSTSGAVSVAYATAPGSATAGSDYTAASGTLTWAAGDSSPKTITVPIANDGVSESPETFTVTLSNALGGAFIGANAAATVTLYDAASELSFTAGTVTANESAGNATFSVQRAGTTSGAVGVSYSTLAGTASAGNDFTAASGTLSWANGEGGTKSFTVPILTNTTYEPDETFTVSLASPSGGAVTVSPATVSVTITDDDSSLAFTSSTATVSEAGGSVQLSVTRTGSTASAISVPWSITAGGATAGSDFTTGSGTLSWAAGDAASKTITVAILNDSSVESAESFTVNLGSPTGQASLGSPSSSTITINDDDKGVAFTASTFTVAESAGTAELLVQRIGATSGALTVSFATANGTATTPDDFTATTGTLAWADGEGGTKAFRVPVTDDTAAESAETFTVSLSSPSAGASLGSPSASTVTVTDDDQDLILHYKFDEGSGGTINDSATVAPDFTTTGLNLPAGNWEANGRFGSAIKSNFDVTPANHGSLPIAPTEAYSIALWFNRNATGSSYEPLLSKGDIVGTRQVAMFTNGGKIVASVGGSTVTSGAVLCDGNWHLLVLVNENVGGTWKTRFYVDGSATMVETNSGTSTSTANFRLGRSTGGGDYYYGHLDDLRIFKKALTAAEIDALLKRPELDVNRAGMSIADGGTDNAGAVTPGAPAALTYTLHNPGGSALGVTTPVTVGTLTNCSANVTVSPATSIAAGSTSNLTVSVTPTASGNWSFTLSIANADADENPYNWTISGSALSSFASWIAGQSNVGALTGALDDPDADGLANLLEYAFNGAAGDPGNTPLPALGTSGNYLTITFERRRDGLTYIVEGSNDLVVWTTIATNPGTLGQIVEVTDTVDLSSGPPRRFLRVRVIAP